MHKTTFHAALFAILLAAAFCGCKKSDEQTASSPNAPKATKGGAITILWAQWPPADALEELGKEYQAKTGTAVNVVQKSWDGAFGDAAQAEFRTNGTAYDLIIGDSQWVGQGVKGGHYLELTDFVKDNQELFKDVAPAALEYYCEYPKGAKKYYAVPCESDAMAFCYRKDLFEDPRHKEMFKSFLKQSNQQEFSLDVPKTWEELYWIAKYFKEGSGLKDMAGVVMPTSQKYDTVTMSFENVLWSFGGGWGDMKSNTVKFDTPQSVQAITFFKKLIDESSEGGKNMGYGDVASAYIGGGAAMAANYFAFFPQIADPSQNKDYADKTGYFNMPAGPKGRKVTLGGQGFSINAHIDGQRQQAAREFLKWFSAPETQQKWATKKGCFTANMKILKSDAFKRATPYNRLFEEAFGMMDDFWSIPQYDQLLEVSQKHLSDVLQNLSLIHI